MEVFVIQNGEQTGPFTRFKLREKLSRGEIDEQTLGWYRGLDEWLPLGEIEALKVVLSESEEGEGPSSPEVAAAQQPTENEVEYSPALRAWIRFWARNLDFAYFLLGTIAFTSLMGWMDIYEFMDPESAAANSLYSFLSLAAWVFVESALLSSFGTTPGRAILGVRVTDAEGEGLTTWMALKRSFFVWFRGMGFGLTILHIVMMGLSYIEITRSNTTWWDSRLGTKVGHQRVTFGRVLMALSLVFLLSGLVMMFSERPPEAPDGAPEATGERAA